MNLKNRTKNILAILAIGTAIWLAGYVLVGKTFVPQSFKDARIRATSVAAELVTLLNDSNENLDQIAELDKKYQFNLASEMVEQEIQRSSGITMKAVELSNEFSIMAESLGAVTPIKARNMADSAIKEELKLISKIIEYSSSMKALLENLNYKFSGDIRYDSGEAQEIISVMNSSAKEVNDLNASYNRKMEEFDGLTK